MIAAHTDDDARTMNRHTPSAVANGNGFCIEPCNGFNCKFFELLLSHRLIAVVLEFNELAMRLVPLRSCSAHKQALS